jgi:hypothetical protein
MRYWIISQEEIPELDADMIEVVFQAICTPKDKQRKVRKSSKETKLEQEKRERKEKMYYQLQSLNPFETENGRNLTGILHCESTTMLTAIENNVRCHFIEYVKRYVNVSFKHQFNESSKEQEIIKKFNCELNKIKTDLLFNRSPSEYKSDPQYHKWIDENRIIILPKLNPDENYYYDTKVNPQKYLKYMIAMNLEIESQQGSMFQFFPLRTDVTPRYITIDTKSLVEILIEQVTYLYTKTHEYGDLIWETFFAVDKIKYDGYQFDQSIMTDGLTVSVRMISPEQKKIKNEMYEKRLQGIRHRQMGLISQEKPKPKPKPKCEKKIINPEFLYIDEVPRASLLGSRLMIDPGKKNLLSCVGDDIDVSFNYTNRQRVSETKRLLYQEELTNRRTKQGIIAIESELSEYNSKTCVPSFFRDYMIKKIEINKRTIESYCDSKYRKYRWYGYINNIRADQKLVEKVKNHFLPAPPKPKKSSVSRNKKRRENKKHKKKKKSIQHLNRTSNQKVKLVIKKDTDLDLSIIQLDKEICQSQKRIQQLKSAVEQLKLEIVQPIIIMGDWSSGKQMRHLQSTPNVRLKRLLNHNFTVYNIDEFRTSCLHYRSEERCENLYLPDKTGKIRKIHSVLTYTMENQRLGCINRDRNGRQNIRKLFHYYLRTGGRPSRYCRG